MYRILRNAREQTADVAAFLELLATLDRQPVVAARELFAGEAEVYVARAPGRLDVMGGIADYSGSLVLQLPIQEAAFVALQKDEARQLTLVSLGGEANKRANRFQMALDELMSDGEAISYAAARQRFRSDAARAWAAYVAGVFLVLMREHGIHFSQGARLLIDSRVPEGKGVSSSAAIEVAVANAVLAAFAIELAPRQVALLCQRVENEVVGAPCGVMDQMTSECGAANQLLALLCQPAELQTPRRLPAELAVWGMDSGIRHSVGGGDYGSVRTGAFMGYRILAELAGLDVEATNQAGVVRLDDRRWHGYLANVTPAEFEQEFAARLPERIFGDEFLRRYQGITDTVTRVQADREYAVRVPTAHPIYENARVHRFAELLDAPLNEASLAELGELMYASHASYSACGLGSAGTDLLVELVRQAGQERGLYGAKITGGGSGGTVAVLGCRSGYRDGRQSGGQSDECGADAAIAEIVAEYARQTGHQPRLFSASSPGAAAFGHIALRGSRG